MHGPAKGVSGEITVTFSKSGKQYPWDPKLGSLLEFAEARGIKIDSQCRAGECGCCQSKLISGDIEYLQELLTRRPNSVLSAAVCLPAARHQNAVVALKVHYLVAGLIITANDRK
ncbi:MAG: 2Fe-2S iron-sulfur cluster binding domain-containing protein [Candidatus Thiodiazotropha sp. (ex Dulcina madagascariensis)]|nr:2Fe-2S iron-sulfur cluster binding domain-containing protein [Candidatus Thiodiazotropha sp. (ex Dulcina madagascariensis)]